MNSFPPKFVRNSDNADLFYFFILINNFLDPARVYIITARDGHILLAVSYIYKYIYKSIFIKFPNIASALLFSFFFFLFSFFFSLLLMLLFGHISETKWTSTICIIVERISCKIVRTVRHREQKDNRNDPSRFKFNRQ